MPIITELFEPQRTNANGGERRSGAPGRTRTSTMLPLPDFESGASTNSATGAGGRNIAAKPGGSTGVQLPSVPAKRASIFRNEAQVCARARAGAQGSAARSCLFSAMIRSWAPRSTQVGFTRLASSNCRSRASPRSVSRLRSPGTRENVAHITAARAPSPHSRVRHRRSCRPGPEAPAPARRPSGRRDPARTSPRPACPRGA